MIHRAIVMSNGETITRNDFYSLVADACVAAAVAVLLPMPGSLLSPMMSKMEITSHVYEEVMSSVYCQLYRARPGQRRRDASAKRRDASAWPQYAEGKDPEVNISARDWRQWILVSGSVDQ